MSNKLDRAIKNFERFVDHQESMMALNEEQGKVTNEKDIEALEDDTLALEALKEKRDRENGCGYCRDGMIILDAEEVKLSIVEGQLLVEVQDKSVKFDISKCLVCGSSLMEVDMKNKQEEVGTQEAD